MEGVKKQVILKTKNNLKFPQRKYPFLEHTKLSVAICCLKKKSYIPNIFIIQTIENEVIGNLFS